ncbi:MAG: DUF58 domain-containing protein [Phycisphaeraceae bacterium]|nr:DUF58 domain-containing protein [Phycisphaeraceae bacterium]
MLTQDLMREVRRLQVRTKRRVEGLFAGEYHTAFKGRGIEFADVREYEPGDDVRTIDWNVTARTGKPFIKRFVEERELTVFLAVDLSASESFLSTQGPRTKRRIAIETAAVLALSASSNHDRVGLCLFTEEIELYLPPGKGRGHSLRLLRELLSFEPRTRGTNFDRVLLRLGHVLPRRGTLFLISDFLAPGGPESFETSLRLLSRKQEVIAVQITDPREQVLPNVGLVEVVDPESGEHRLLDTASKRIRTEYQAAALRRESQLARLFGRTETDRVVLSTERPFVQDLVRYFQMRERRR